MAKEDIMALFFGDGSGVEFWYMSIRMLSFRGSLLDQDCRYFAIFSSAVNRMAWWI